jgi:cytochrome P450
MDFPSGLQTPEQKLDPFDWYRENRRTNPVSYDAQRDCWDAFTYDAVQQALTDHESFSSAAHPDRENTMSNTDPPLHTRLRGPVEEFFKPGAVAHMEPEIRQKTEELFDEAIQSGPEREFDAVADVAYHLPIMTIAGLLGVPEEERDQFKQWSNTIVAAPDTFDNDWEQLEAERNQARKELTRYFVDLFEKRKEDPQDDLVSKILHLEGEEQLTDNQILNLCILLLIAGNVSTTQLLAWSMFCLSQRPELVEEIRGDERAIRTTVEETLRYRSSVQRLLRTATTDVELAGKQIEAGDDVVVWLGSANRDGEQFDNPDTFVHDRQPNPHLAFGRGIHICLGAGLARLEAKITLQTLLDRFDSIRPVETEYEPISSPFLYGVKELPLAYERA